MQLVDANLVSVFLHAVNDRIVNQVFDWLGVIAVSGDVNALIVSGYPLPSSDQKLPFIMV